MVVHLKKNHIKMINNSHLGLTCVGLVQRVSLCACWKTVALASTSLPPPLPQGTSLDTITIVVTIIKSSLPTIARNSFFAFHGAGIKEKSERTESDYCGNSSAVYVAVTKELVLVRSFWQIMTAVTNCEGTTTTQRIRCMSVRV